VNRFVKWSTLAIATAAGVALMYHAVATARRRLEQGLGRVERIATDAQRAVSRAEQALGHTADTVRQIRASIA
jgi:hypothetical protein